MATKKELTPEELEMQADALLAAADAAEAETKPARKSSKKAAVEIPRRRPSVSLLRCTQQAFATISSIIKMAKTHPR